MLYMYVYGMHHCQISILFLCRRGHNRVIRIWYASLQDQYTLPIKKGSQQSYTYMVCIIARSVYSSYVEGVTRELYVYGMHHCQISILFLCRRSHNRVIRIWHASLPDQYTLPM